MNRSDEAFETGSDPGIDNCLRKNKQFVGFADGGDNQASISNEIDELVGYQPKTKADQDRHGVTINTVADENVSKTHRQAVQQAEQVIPRFLRQVERRRAFLFTLSNVKGPTTGQCRRSCSSTRPIGWGSARRASNCEHHAALAASQWCDGDVARVRDPRAR